MRARDMRLKAPPVGHEFYGNQYGEGAGGSSDPGSASAGGGYIDGSMGEGVEVGLGSQRIEHVRDQAKFLQGPDRPMVITSRGDLYQGTDDQATHEGVMGDAWEDGDMGADGDEPPSGLEAASSHGLTMGLIGKGSIKMFDWGSPASRLQAARTLRNKGFKADTPFAIHDDMGMEHTGTLGDFLAGKFKERNMDPTTFKAPPVGHEFYGNQYGEGAGGSGRDSGDLPHAAGGFTTDSSGARTYVQTAPTTSGKLMKINPEAGQAARGTMAALRKQGLNNISISHNAEHNVTKVRGSSNLTYHANPQEAIRDITAEVQRSYPGAHVSFDHGGGFGEGGHGYELTAIITKEHSMDPTSEWLGWLQQGVAFAGRMLGVKAKAPDPAPVDFSMRIFKQADGNYRWVTFSSSAFRDRDREIVSQKALEQDVAYADSTGQYGPLRWWHTPIVLGLCDFNAMAGRILIESGTFKSATLGAAFQEAADGLTVSIGFKHPPDEPDAGGVFKTIRRFERSLLPAGRESNLFTQLAVKEQEAMAIDKSKLKALEDLVGADMARTLVAQAETAEKAADLAGIAFKAAPPFPPKDEPDGDEELGPDGKPIKKKPGTPPPPPMDEKKVKELVEASLTPLTQELEQIKQLLQAQAPAPEQEAQKAAQTDWEAKVKAMQAQLDELLGSQPRRSKGYRPSTDPNTVVKEAAEGPVVNQDFAGFLGFAVSGQTPPNGTGH